MSVLSSMDLLGHGGNQLSSAVPGSGQDVTSDKRGLLKGDNHKQRLRSTASSEEGVLQSTSSGQDAASKKVRKNYDPRSGFPIFADLLEQIDIHKRSGRNLRKYFEVWQYSNTAAKLVRLEDATSDAFLEACSGRLDEGAGRYLELKDCSRAQLDRELVSLPDLVTLYWEDEDGSGEKHIKVPLLSGGRVDWSYVEDSLGRPVQIFFPDQDATFPPCDRSGLTRDSLLLDSYKIRLLPLSNSGGSSHSSTSSFFETWGQILPSKVTRAREWINSFAWSGRSLSSPHGHSHHHLE